MIVAESTGPSVGPFGNGHGGETPRRSAAA